MFERSALSRIMPFATYMLFMVLEDVLRKYVGVNASDLRWIYPAKIIAVLSVLLYFRQDYDELRQRLKVSSAAIAIAVGVVIFIIWINANMKWMVMGTSSGYDPRSPQGSLDWFFVVIRLAGAALVVPVMEELFFRSFLMRWMANPKFQQVEPQQIPWHYLLLVSGVFAIEHTLWFAGLLAGLAYGLLYMRCRNLWAPVLSHGITNGVLGVWVILTGSWQYW
ncbi:MAG: CAAX prenyl protease-related protein [Burkholderiales bacterium]|nr:CAAX prenyl protease-related protein [Burkholderiales bacterium]